MKRLSRRLALSSTALAALVLSACVPVEPVEYVEVDRYLGTWYELASYPAIFQRQCYGGTTATYAAIPDSPGELSVLNQCRVGSLDGEIDSAEARARIVDGETNAKLKVYFGFFPGDYWIIDLDPAAGDEPYRWAVVSEPTRNFLWILSRTPSLDDETLDGILDRLEDQNYKLDKLRWTPQITD